MGRALTRGSSIGNIKSSIRAYVLSDFNSAEWGLPCGCQGFGHWSIWTARRSPNQRLDSYGSVGPSEHDSWFSWISTVVPSWSKLNLRSLLISLSGALLCSEFELSASVWPRRFTPGKSYSRCCRFRNFFTLFCYFSINFRGRSLYLVLSFRA